MKDMKHTAYARYLALALVLAACAGEPAKKMGYVYAGMTRNQVVGLLGKPQKSIARNGGEKMIFFGNTNEKEYWVYLKDDKVTRYGAAADFRREATPDR